MKTPGGERVLFNFTKQNTLPYLTPSTFAIVTRLVLTERALSSASCQEWLKPGKGVFG